MKERKNASREGYLNENYHFFHLKDTAGQELDYHFHEFDKLVLLYSGEVDYAVESGTYALMPGDVLLVPRHSIHKAVINISCPYDRVIIYLDRRYFDRIMPEAGLAECFERADRSREYLLKPDRETGEKIRDTVAAYEKLSGESGFGTDALKDSLMIQLLVYISRAAPERSGGRKAGRDPKIEDTLSYINENLSSELNVELLAERVFLSKYYFMRLFKANTGSTVHEYIRQKRLLNAARLIRGGSNAAKAAADSGFSDYSAFHRAFTDSFGISPGRLK